MMEIETLVLQNDNNVLHAYKNDDQFIHTFFDYKNEEASYPRRIKELSERHYSRMKLAEVIRSYMEPFGISAQASKHIEELADDGVVVIGGQQAGIMTGPLYSVHKAVTVLILAEQQRKQLDIPVIPVFWVAGEDHDLNEINHVYTETAGKVTKKQYDEKFVFKWMASDAVYTEAQMVSFVEDVFRQFGENSHTKTLKQNVLEAVKLEKTFTSFFVRLMNGLFKEQGLLFIDSAYKPLREIESEHFNKLICEADKLSEMIVRKEDDFENRGFTRPIQAQVDAANLFYVHETGRILLSKRDGQFVNDSLGIRFTEEEMMRMATEQPWLLSNNVATRPIMQDFVFPVLAFVGGAGEIAYWALLKESFHHLGIKMPIIVPRISITLVTPKVQQLLKELSLTVEDVMAGKVHEDREKLLESLQNEDFEQLLKETEHRLDMNYKELMSEASKGMKQILQKNLTLHKKQFDYLRGKMEEELLIQNDVTLRKYSKVENELLPDGSLQERIFTPYFFMNSYGDSLVDDLLQQTIMMDGEHKVVYL